MKTLAILYICTGPYAVFWHDFYPNFKANFLPDCDRTFYVFTDAAHIDYEDAPRRAPHLSEGPALAAEHNAAL